MMSLPTSIPPPPSPRRDWKGILAIVLSGAAIVLAFVAWIAPRVRPLQPPTHVGSLIPPPIDNGAQGSFMGEPTGAGVFIYDALCRGEDPIISQAWIPDGGGCVSFVESPALAPFEECHFADEVNFTVPGTVTSEVIKRELLGRWNGKNCIVPDGGLSIDHPTYVDLGTNPLDASAALQVLDGSVVLTGCTSAAAVVRDSRSGNRCMAPWQGNDAAASVDGSTSNQAVLEVWPNVVSPFVDASTTLTITTTYGGGIGAYAANLGNYALTNVAQVAGRSGQPNSLHQVTATLPPAPPGGYLLGDSGTVPVSVSAEFSPATCAAAAGCFKFGSTGATITSVVSTTAHPAGWLGAVGGDPLQFTGVGFVSGGSLAISCNGVPVTSLAFVSGTTVTGVAPAQTGVSSPTSSFDCSGTNGDGSPIANAPAVITYNSDPSQYACTQWWVRADRNVTHPSTVNSWAPLKDISSWGAATQATGANQPTYTASWTNGLPAVSSLTGSTLYLQTAGFTALNAPYYISVTGQMNGAYSASAVLFAGKSASTIDPSVWDFGSGAHQAYLEATGGSIQSTALASMTSPFRIDGLFQTSGTGVYNNAAFPGSSTGNLSGSTLGSGITLMASSTATHPMNGYLGEVLVQNCAPSGAVVTAYDVYEAAFWGFSF